ncbi:MAG: hypothetical protein OES26_17385 [Gammaproteobacteria bacterium]|nr:hypothetical protein [Gammaproteobacteria bacterium]
MIRNGLCGIGLSIGLGAVAVAPAAPTPKIDSQYVRANCTGVFKYSTTQHHVQCAIENVLEDADGTLIPGYSSAFADRRRGRLRAAAAGASVDDANYNGHQAAALFKDTLRISGDWSGPIPVTVSMWVHYRFEGIGDAQLWAQLSATETPRLTVRNRARIELRHGGTNRVQLTNAHSQGNFSAPENGPYEPQSLLILRVTQMVDARRPEIDIRSHLQSFALPNSRPMRPVVSALIRAEGRLVVTAPSMIRIESESGFEYRRIRRARAVTTGTRAARRGQLMAWGQNFSLHSAPQSDIATRQ